MSIYDDCPKRCAGCEFDGLVDDKCDRDECADTTESR